MQYKLESLRGVAACLVVLVHSPFNYGSDSLSFISNSYFFVDFFFVLSGFVMSLAYSSRIHSGLGFKEYSLLRLGRVYPLHFIMLFLWIPYIVVKQYLFDSGFGGSTQLDKNNLASFFSNIFLINSMGVHNHLSWNYPSWSISTEFFSYIVFFVFTITVDKKGSFAVPLVISAGCYCFLISLDRSSLDITYDYGFFRCLAAFYLGVFVNRISKHIKFSENTRNNLSALETLCIVSVVILISVAELDFLLFIPIIAFFAVSILVFSQRESGIWGRILLTPLFKSIGKWSYSIYMIHALVLAGVSNIFEYLLKWDIQSSLGFYSLIINFLSLLVIIVLSKYSYSLVEKPFRDKSKILVRRYGKAIQI